MVVTGEVDEAVPIVAVNVSDENRNGSLTLIVTEFMVSAIVVLLAIVKVPPATVAPGAPLPFPDLVTVTTVAGVAAAAGAPAAFKSESFQVIGR